MSFGKRDFAYNVLATVICFWLVSCSNEDYVEHIGSALMSPQVTLDATAVAVDGTVSGTLISPMPTVGDLRLKITNLQTGNTAEWSSVYDYPADNSFTPGRYFVEAAYGDSITEGFGCPYFYASKVVDLTDGANVTVPLVAKLSSCMVQVRYTQRFRDYFVSYRAVLHSMGGAYVDYPADESRDAFLHPGKMSVQLELTMPESGRTVLFEAATMPKAKAGYTYVATVDMEMAEAGVPAVVVSFDGKVESDDVVTALTPEFLAASVPEIECSGFEPGRPLEWIEGTATSVPICMSVSRERLRSLVLTTRSPLLCAMGWPAGVNILDAGGSVLDTMRGLGAKITESADMVTIDFAGVLPRLRYAASEASTLFTLEAVGNTGKLLQPVTLEVVSLPVDLKVVNAVDIVAGINVGEILIESPTDQLSGNLELLAFVNNKWTPMPITDITPRGNARYAVKFTAPGGTDAVMARVVYCGMVKAELRLKRVSPKYTISVDFYAMKAVVKVNAENTGLMPVITSMLRVYGNDNPLQVIEVDEENGILVLGSLSPSTYYRITASVMAHPAAQDYCPAVEGSTEAVQEFANGSFEDREKNFEYKDMYSGGRYSQNIVPIFNQQNRRSFEVFVPEKWANTNSKTACISARNHNTWYMCPSVQIVEDAYGGTYAVMLQSVGWDVNGEAIPDYLQPYGNYTPYSCNVPHISHRAAGRLFLGDYSFNARTVTEDFGSGISFGSRPSALNGFYKFVPSPSDPNDRGVAFVEVIGLYRGMEIVIARSQVNLRPALTYTAFSVPLTYNHFGVKAIRLRVMMASTFRYGSIAEESVNVSVQPNLELASSIGSTLWVDELSLSY